jgi:hypothetical protein
LPIALWRNGWRMSASETISPRQLDQRDERSTTPRSRAAVRRRLQRVEDGRRTSFINAEVTGRLRVPVKVDYPRFRARWGDGWVAPAHDETDTTSLTSGRGFGAFTEARPAPLQLVGEMLCLSHGYLGRGKRDDPLKVYASSSL